MKNNNREHSSKVNVAILAACLALSLLSGAGAGAFISARAVENTLAQTDKQSLEDIQNEIYSVTRDYLTTYYGTTDTGSTGDSGLIIADDDSDAIAKQAAEIVTQKLLNNSIEGVVTEDELTALETKLTNMISSYNLTDTQIQDLAQTVAAIIEADLDSLSSGEDTNTALSEAVLKNIAALESRVSSLESRTTATEEAISLLQTNVSSLQTQTTSTTYASSSSVSDLSSKYNDLVSKYNEQLTTINELASSNSNNAATLTALSTQLTNLSSGLNTMSSNLTAEIESLETQVAAIEEENNNASDSATEAQIAEQEQKISDLEDEISSINNAITAKTVQISNLEVELNNTASELQSAIDETTADLSADIADAQASLQAEIEQASADLQAELDSANAELEALQVDLAARTEELTQAKSDLTALTERVADLTTTVETNKEELQNKIDTLTTELEAVEEQKANLSTLQTLVDDMITALGGTVDTSQPLEDYVDESGTTTETGRITALKELVSDLSSRLAALEALNPAQIKFDVQDGTYGYYNASGSFVDFKSQTDIDSAVSGAIDSLVGTVNTTDKTYDVVASAHTDTQEYTKTLSIPFLQSQNLTVSSNNSAYNSLRAGDIVTIPTGYYTGEEIIITAASLQSQTEATAAASQILSGYTAWVNGSKVTGTISSKAAATYTPTTSNQTIAAGLYLSGIQTIEGDSNLVAANIAKGKSIFGVAGSYTSDATATAAQILSGKTAYVNGSKVTGTIASKAATTYNTSTSDQTIAAGQYLSGAQTIKAVTTSNISAANIKSGITVKVGDANNAGRIANVTGTFTSDATAAATDILSGKTAYVNGSKVTGSMANKSGAVASGTVGSYALSGTNYLKMPIASAGYYDTSDYLYSTSVKYNPTGTGGTAATSGTTVSSSSSSVSLAGSNLILDSGAKVTIPAGYYSSAINVSSGGSATLEYHDLFNAKWQQDGIQNAFPSNTKTLIVMYNMEVYCFFTNCDSRKGTTQQGHVTIDWDNHLVTTWVSDYGDYSETCRLIFMY